MRAARVAVVVVGEFVRSPRMRNHVSQLSTAGFPTVVLGFAKHSPDLPENVAFVRLRAFSRIGEHFPKVLFLIGSGIRMGLLFFSLTWKLICTRATRILVQNP